MVMIAAPEQKAMKINSTCQTSLLGIGGSWFWVAVKAEGDLHSVLMAALFD
jgi:hypothetical protein